MTMHIVGPWLNNTSSKKRQPKITKSQQEEIERGWRERNARLKEMGLPKETLEQYTDWLYGRGKKEKTKEIYRQSGKEPVAKKTSRQSSVKVEEGNDSVETIPPKSLGLWITGPISSKPSPVYTGTKVIGISQMAKSNAVPVFSEEVIIEIARMRR